MSNESVGNLHSTSKHIDSHLRPFKCRKPDCANQAFSSVALRLRHERDMHKMHFAEEYLCRYPGPCDRNQSGNGFARSFNRGDHERRVHHMIQKNTRSEGRPNMVLESLSVSATRGVAQASKRRQDRNLKPLVATELKAEGETIKELEERLGRAEQEAAELRKELQRLECPICCKERSDTVTQCGHLFCEGCITTWRSQHASCPKCRKPIRNLTKIYA